MFLSDCPDQDSIYSKKITINWDGVRQTTANIFYSSDKNGIVLIEDEEHEGKYLLQISDFTKHMGSGSTTVNGYFLTDLFKFMGWEPEEENKEDNKEESGEEGKEEQKEYPEPIYTRDDIFLHYPALYNTHFEPPTHEELMVLTQMMYQVIYKIEEIRTGPERLVPIGLQKQNYFNFIYGSVGMVAALDKIIRSMQQQMIEPIEN